MLSTSAPRVLLIRLSSLGDVILMTAAVEALRQDVPDAKVDVLTKPVFWEVFRGHPGVAQVLEWDVNKGLALLARLVRARGYDWIVDLHGNLRTRALRLLVTRPRWSRYGKDSLRRRVAVHLHRPDLLSPDHAVDRYIRALGPLGGRPVRRLPRMYPGARERARADGLLRAAGWDRRQPLVGLAPGARWATKAWPPDRWADLIRVLVLDGFAFPVLLGGRDEAGLCGSILDSSGTGGANLAGRTSILDAAAVLKTCSVLVSNDSAPLHVATAVGTPVVALFGPTVRGFGFYPIGPHDAVVEAHLDCRPCSLHGGDACPQGHHRCLCELEAPEVANVVRGVMSDAQPTPPACARGQAPVACGGSKTREGV